MSEATRRLLFATLATTTVSASQFVGDTDNVTYVSTQIGERHSIKLGDGSQITLNTDSSIKSRTDGTSLQVEVLRGEVLFAMQPNAMRHLVVSAGGLNILDTATVFDVRLNSDGQVRVTVEEGEVRLSSGRLSQIPVEHNQQAIADEHGGLLKLRKGLSSKSIERQLAWREGRLTFVCEPLSEVAREFNRYNRTRLEVDPRIKDEQFGGDFSATDVVEFVELMPHLDASIHWERIEDARGAPTLRLYQAANATPTARHSAPCTHERR
jgi:transmembrane sensor